MEARLSEIGTTLRRVLRIAESEGISTDAAAGRLAADRIEAARRGSSGPT
jgi:hypothetical protein